MGKDYYKVLDVDKNASKEEIKKAYKKLAKKYHPDVSKEEDASERFKEVNEAAAVLGDDEKRKQFDQFGSDSFKQGQGFNPGDFSGFGGDFGDIFDNLGDIFGGGFGSGSGRRSSRRKGSDLRADMEITLEEAYNGVKKKMTVPKQARCSDCSGKGGSGLETCDHCHGSGVVRDARRTPFGIFQTTAACPSCNGTGEMISDMCDSCEGTGMVKETKKLSVDIPEGIEHGSRLRLSGEGEAGYRDGGYGDLYVVVHIKSHSVFERDGHDIILEAPVSIVQASLGASIEVPTLEGKSTMKIPTGTQSGTVFKMKGKGMPYLHSYGYGDQLVNVVVETPRSLNRTQEKAMKELAAALGEKVEPSKGLFGKLFK